MPCVAPFTTAQEDNRSPPAPLALCTVRANLEVTQPMPSHSRAEERPSPMPNVAPFMSLGGCA